MPVKRDFPWLCTSESSARRITSVMQCLRIREGGRTRKPKTRQHAAQIPVAYHALPINRPAPRACHSGIGLSEPRGNGEFEGGRRRGGEGGGGVCPLGRGRSLLGAAFAGRAGGCRGLPGASGGRPFAALTGAAGGPYECKPTPSSPGSPSGAGAAFVPAHPRALHKQGHKQHPPLA